MEPVLDFAPELRRPKTGLHHFVQRTPALFPGQAGGQGQVFVNGARQRLCLARTLAMEPEVILLDEPTSGLDPISTAKIEATLHQLKNDYTIVLVSNNTKQIARATDRVAFLLMGHILEIGDTKQVFTVPANQKTDDYISGRFG